MDTNKQIINWLLDGDPSIRWQTLRDLTDANKIDIKIERKKVTTEGWGKRLLELQDENGMWGKGLYSPKWISTTYTMLLLRRIGLEQKNRQAQKACKLLLDEGFYYDGGINYSCSREHSETCVTGMILSLLAYFKYNDKRVNLLVEHLLSQRMKDSGWNCESFNGAVHSSFHTTISVLEGLREYEKSYPKNQFNLQIVQKKAREFLLQHRLFKSHRTDKIVDTQMTRFSFPPRWRYDVLRALDYFQECKADYDERLNDAIELLFKKRKPDIKWLLQNRHPGKTYFEMEEVGKPSRWNTLRALRVLMWWDEIYP